MSDRMKFEEPQGRRKTTEPYEELDFVPIYELDAKKEDETKEVKKESQHELIHQNKENLETASRKGPPSGRGGGRQNQGDEEADRIAAMLERIRKTLGKLVYLDFPQIPKQLSSEFRSTWSEADKNLVKAIVKLKDPAERLQMMPEIEAAGFTGEMLQMKETSLNYHLDRVDRAIPEKRSKEKSKWRRLIKWCKSGFKVMNSVMGSLKFIPGVEVGKEVKEHVEAAYDVAETALEK
jgi:hypothetical protein